MIKIKLTLLLWLVSGICFASDAYVKTDEEFGQGYYREHDGRCFFITPAHVVEDAFDISLVGADGKERRARLDAQFPGDIAVLKVKGQNCPQGSWSDGKKLTANLSVHKTGVVKTRLSDGSLIQTPVDIIFSNRYSDIVVRPSRAEDSFMKGFSGSILYIANAPAGMLLKLDESDSQNAIAVRQDALRNSLALYFSETVDNVQSSAEEIAIDFALGKSKVIKEKLAEGAKKTYQFEAEKNSPIKFGVTASRPLNLDVRVNGAEGNALYQSKNIRGGLREFVYTPQESGIYSIELNATRAEGMFELKLETYASSTELMSPENVMVVDQAARGVIADGAVSEYLFKGEKNSPLLFKLMALDRLIYRVAIFDELNREIYRHKQYIDSKGREFAFTPLENQTYTLRVEGDRDHGEFNILPTQLAYNVDLVGMANRFRVGDEINGVIAPDALAKFYFLLEEGRRVDFVFDVQQLYGLDVWVTGGRSDVKLSHNNLSFTAPYTGEYVLQVKGKRGHGPLNILTSADTPSNYQGEIHVGKIVKSELPAGSARGYGISLEKGKAGRFELKAKEYDHLEFYLESTPGALYTSHEGRELSLLAMKDATYYLWVKNGGANEQRVSISSSEISESDVLTIDPGNIVKGMMHADPVQLLLKNEGIDFFILEKSGDAEVSLQVTENAKDRSEKKRVSEFCIINPDQCVKKDTRFVITATDKLVGLELVNRAKKWHAFEVSVEIDQAFVERRKRLTRPPGTVFQDDLKSGVKGPEMVVIPAGEFKFGDTAGEGEADEKPVLTRKFQKPFAISRYEITFDEYDHYFKQRNSYRANDQGFGRDRRPVINVRWKTALDYVKFLSKQTGQNYRLPTEEEWEYVAKAGSLGNYSWGDNVKPGQANCAACENKSVIHRKTEPVGSYSPNAFGVYDMHGNVWEFTSSCVSSTHSQEQIERERNNNTNSPLGCKKRNHRIIRGGGWLDENVSYLRSANRNSLTESAPSPAVGIRVVRELEEI